MYWASVAAGLDALVAQDAAGVVAHVEVVVDLHRLRDGRRRGAVRGVVVPGVAASRSPRTAGRAGRSVRRRRRTRAIQRCTSALAWTCRPRTPSSSSTIRRLCRTRSESVWTTIPSSTLRAQDGTSTREPSTSTTHTRQALIGVRFGAQHRVGVSARPPGRHVEDRRALGDPDALAVDGQLDHAAATGRCGTDVPVTSRSPKAPSVEMRRRDGAGRGLPEAADRGVVHRPAPTSSSSASSVCSRAERRAAGQPAQRLLLAHRADPAGHALPARLVAEERGDAAQRCRSGRRSVVEGQHHAGPERGARSRGCPRRSAARRARRAATKAPAAPPSSTAAQLAAHPAGQRRAARAGWCRTAPRRRRGRARAPETQNSLRAGRALRADRGERRAADGEDLQHVEQRLDVVDHGRLAEQAAARGERRLVARLAAEALDRVEQRGLLAADVGARRRGAARCRTRSPSPMTSSPRKPRRRAGVDRVLQPARGAAGTRRGCRGSRARSRWRSRRSSSPRPAPNGSPSISTRSLNVPGSDSSALQTR